ncbi:MAG: bacteriophage abortive infection AbiH family protein [Parafannyhessea umbonata]|uniref:AbiH family protein n=1 Tax=Parafannyhessea umbonata TaxID=604330 RepID=UPI0026EAE054|nr:AbiH family protein [Parafannyhessea umbonata]MCI6680949.1 bacteriophage abortive infection AbiH family protein [Parafannyhessea umbonata]
MNIPSHSRPKLDLTPIYQKLADIQPPMPDMRPSWHQLVVIGNGFDLECKLRSSFTSFISARNEAFEQEENGEPNPLGFKRNLWDVILESMDGDHWADVEGAIARWVVPMGWKDTNSEFWQSSIDKTIDVLRDISRGKKSTFDSKSIPDKVALYLSEGSPQKARQWNKEKLLELTRSDLECLEKEFSAYLAQAEKDQPDYRENARKLICELILQGRPNEKDYDIEESVLSFNYTHPIKSLGSEEHETSYINIHGRLGGEIVFGIDGTGRMDDPAVTPFTKTYRLLSLDVSDTRSLVHAASPIGYQDYGTALIKFYGHSLGSADYSYFQAIFDSVHLYEGQTQLIFFYRRHGDKTSEEVRVETMRQVIKLLDAYGRTLDNKDHGKNLIHKLLIEGRLAVKELPDTVRRK